MNNLTHIYGRVVSVSGCSIFLHNEVLVALPQSAEGTVRRIETGDTMLLELDLKDSPYTVAAHVMRDGRHVYSFFIGTKDPKQAVIEIKDKKVHHDI